MKKHTKIFFFAIVLTLLMSFVSAGIGDWIKGITGRATQGTTNITVTVAGAAMVSIIIYNETITGTANDPAENSIKPITFVVGLTDANGVADINNSGVSANFSYVGEAVRQNNSCSAISGQSTTTSQNFSCTIGMYYFDTPGVWTITARGNDLGNTTYNQTTKTFTYDSLTAMVISPGALTWSAVTPGQENATSGNDPTLINNTGNYNITNVTVTALDLLGETNTAFQINAGNMSVSVDNGGSPPAECSGMIMANNTEKQITSAQLLRGNHSVGDGSTGQEQLYYCFKTIPSNIPSQTYSTAAGGSWTIKIVQ
jgi:hypothetical protein